MINDQFPDFSSAFKTYNNICRAAKQQEQKLKQVAVSESVKSTKQIVEPMVKTETSVKSTVFNAWKKTNVSESIDVDPTELTQSKSMSKTLSKTPSNGRYKSQNRIPLDREQYGNFVTVQQYQPPTTNPESNVNAVASTPTFIDNQYVDNQYRVVKKEPRFKISIETDEDGFQRKVKVKNDRLL